ncbi:glycosyltransferase family 87 protein [Azospirillum picis]|uniref:DUF2029 domain-containing protein n=1 Tax=Azospirillum picis TaxID=488438 RepID=A0ABU0MJF0_9PROT|nr:glycosyltransferase family 87 protein [Azospirillum picis]MBP2299795.1 hypothetical protein [Azospirillum picis]MDQ0533591.1 hypothetical protein [Azospirillum picis]
MPSMGHVHFDAAGDDRSAVWSIVAALLFVLLVDSLFGFILRPYLDGSDGDTTVWDVLVLIFVGNPERLPLDSWEPMMTALAWLHQHGGKDVYDAVFFTQHVKFQYPLTSLLPLELLSALHLLHLRVYALINLLMVVASAAGMALLMRDLSQGCDAGRPPTLRDQVPTRRWAPATLGIVATLCFYPITKAFAVGQIQVWLNAAFIFAALFYLRDRRLLAGLLLGGSTLIKPQMSLFLVWALLRRDWRFALGWTAVVVPGFAAATALYGLGPSLHYLDVLSFLGRHGESYYSNQTVNGLLHRLLHNGPNLLSMTSSDAAWRGSAFAPYHPLVHAATLVTGILFGLFGLLWRAGGKTGDRMASFLVAGLCFTIGSPISWVPHYGVMLPAFAVLLFILLGRLRSDRRRTLRDLLLLGTAFAIMSNDFFRPLDELADTPFNVLQSYLFFSGLLLLGLLVGTAGRQGAPDGGRPVSLSGALAAPGTGKAAPDTP